MTQPSLLDIPAPEPQPRIYGPDVTEADRIRLRRQFREVRTVMLDGLWHTLRELSRITGHPEASVSARLREINRLCEPVVKERIRPEGGQRRYRLQLPE